MSTLSLFEPVEECICLHHGGHIRVVPGFVSAADGHSMMASILDETSPSQHHVLVGPGLAMPQPRLTAWVGDPSATYAYSGLQLAPAPWTPTLIRLLEQVQNVTQKRYNSVLVNYYRNGQDSIGMHADDEPELGREPTIASLSLGDTRTFVIKPMYVGEQKMSIQLEHGMLLVMSGKMQRHYKHGINKENSKGPRLNLTFRWTEAPQ